MALVAITLKIMPTSPQADLAKLKADVEKRLTELGGKVANSKEEPIAFGLKALIFVLSWKEDQDPDVIETELAKIENVNSVQVTDVRRALG